MSEPFIGTVCYFAFGFPPKGWALCNGQTLPINSNQALFSLLGTTYGGNGIQTFQLPNLQGRVALGGYTNTPTYPVGGVGGEETHKLVVAEIPAHNHVLNADGATAASNNVATPGLSTVLGTAASYANTGISVSVYANGTSNATMAPQTIGNAGADQPHENRMPYQVVSACIALTGIFPSRN